MLSKNYLTHHNQEEIIQDKNINFAQKNLEHHQIIVED